MFSMKDVSARFKQRPFTPVRVVTSAGETYDVMHPDLVLVGQRELVIGIGTSDEPQHHDRLARVSILHITAMDDLPAPASGPSQDGNGNGRQ